MGGQQSPPDNRAAGCGLGHSGPPWSPRPRCRGCSRAPPGPAWAPEVSGARLPAVTPYCLGAAAASPQPSCRWASLRFRLLPAGACTSVSPQADTGASIQSSGLQLAPPPLPEPAGIRGQGRRLARPALLPRSPGWGGVTLQIFPPAHLEFERLPAGPRGFRSSQARAGCCGTQKADPFTPGRGWLSGDSRGRRGRNNHLGTSGSQSLSEHHLLTYLETRVFENQMHFWSDHGWLRCGALPEATHVVVSGGNPRSPLSRSDFYLFLPLLLGPWKSNQAIHEWNVLGSFVQKDAVASPTKASICWNWASTHPCQVLRRGLNSRKTFRQAPRLYFHAPQPPSPSVCKWVRALPCKSQLSGLPL